MEDIAVIGIGLRFPGNASSPEDLWKVLERGESQWSEFPKDRLNIDGYFHPSGDRQGSISFRGAHFLKENYAAFDAPFFSVAAEDAKAIDPQQRILLEASYEALENAGIRKDDISGSDAAVYVGSFVKDYEQICLRDPDWQPQYAATGNGIAIMANRISYFFNLHGPSMTIDTGCSGSLVSVHLAAQSLRNGESSLAIAAGAGMILTPNTIMPMTALNFLSPDGKCFTFDARANGYGRGEGIGVVVMKRLSDAIRDNDTIRSVIRATRVNQDGHTTGITLPSKEAQVANIRAIYESAGLDSNQTAYVECHGTGTQAGDWRELKAISESLGTTRSIDNPIIVGSIKPNIGHLEGAAGVAGLIKGVLTLERGKIPPNINFETANPNIDFEGWRVKVPTEMMEWPLSGLRRVSVNCFGFGGTNAHVIMDEAPRYMSSRGLQANHNSIEDSIASNHIADTNSDTSPRFNPQIFYYSSHEKAGVQRVMKSHLPYLSSKVDTVDCAILRNYAYTLGCRRSNLEWKGFIVASSTAELVTKLEQSSEASAYRAAKDDLPKLCFVFCGQGAQWAQMGKDLLSFQVFRDSLQQASVYMQTYLQCPVCLLEEILKEPRESHITEPEIAQPAITALQIALVDLLTSFGILPSYVVGHSSGEVAAAYASKAISREEAWEIAYYRGLAASIIPWKDPNLIGAMLIIGMSAQKVESYLTLFRYDSEIACINSPRSVTISGNFDEIERISMHLSSKGTFNRLLPVKTAYHSSHMKLVEDDYRATLRHIEINNFPRMAKMFSSVTGSAIGSLDLDKDYWVKNMVSPVQYVRAVEAMMSLPEVERPDLIIELSPAATLKSPTMDIIAATGLRKVPNYCSILDRKTHGEISLLNVIGELWVQGYPIDMRAVISQGSALHTLKSLVDLPPYPWNHERSYWHESHLGHTNRFREFARQDLIGAPTADAISFEPRWRGFLRTSENPWLQDHQVQKTIVYPAAGMVTMVLQGASQVTKEKQDLLGYEITDMRIDKAMIIPKTTHGLEMAMNFKQKPLENSLKGNGRAFDFAIYSKQLDGPWEQHASGSVQIRHRQGDWGAMCGYHLHKYEALKDSCTESINPRQLYELLDVVGMNYGPLFQNITHITKGNSTCVSKVRVPDTKSKMPAKFEYNHMIHPATLDSMFQTLFAIDSEPMVPTYIKSLFVSTDIRQDIGSEFTGYAIANRTGIRDASAKIVMTQSDWDQPSIVASDIHFTGISTMSGSAGEFLPNHRNLCTEIIWEEDITSAQPQELESLVKLLAHKNPGIAVLQIGGSLNLMHRLLHGLTPDLNQASWISRYTVAKGYHEDEDIFFTIKGTSLETLVELRAIDGPDPLPDYNLILVCNTESINSVNYSKHLRTDGFLLTQRCSPAEDNIVFNCGVDGIEPLVFQYQRLQIPVESLRLKEAVVLFPEVPSPQLEAMIMNMRHVFKAQRSELFLTIIQSGEVLHNSSCIEGKVVISLLDFPSSGENWSVFDWKEPDFKVFTILQKHAKGIIWVTHSAYRNPVNPKGSPIVALSRTLMSEDPLKTLVSLDLGLCTKLDDEWTAEAVLAVFSNTFQTCPSSGPRETEYAEEYGKLFIPRLRPVTVLNKMIENDASHDISDVSFSGTEDRLKLEIGRPGLGDGSLSFTKVSDSEPAAGEVEIDFFSATITHVDYETVMGRSAETLIGLDVCGSVRRVGSGVDKFVAGDNVVALAPSGAFGNIASVDSRFVKKIMCFDILLSHYVSAGYALLRGGKKFQERFVLIHAGASTFGLAAVEIATRLGYTIFTTVMGSNASAQRDTLRRCGLKKHQILDGDSDSFAKIIKNRTDHKGVDIVYNSTQEHVGSNFNCVRKGGLIFQFANRSPNPPAFQTTPAAVTFVSFDLSQILRDDPDDVAEMLEKTMSLLPGSAAGVYVETADHELIELPRFKDAFLLIGESPYIGRTSLFCHPDQIPKVPVAVRKHTKPLHQSLSEDKTYVLAGGLGGLGQSICDLLVKNGVRHVAFLSRSGASSEASKSFMASLEAQGVDARVYRVDICDKQMLQNVVTEKIMVDMPPVQGVFQCAAVIKDAVFDNMSYSDWITAFKPKTAGSANLMETLGSHGSDPFFVFLSSSAGAIGTRGQANYAAGNCFQDALAQSYRAKGKHAVSIDLGPVLGAGMLAEDEEILDMLRASGFYGIRHQDFLKVVSHAITMELAPGVPMPAQVIMGVGTGGLIQQNQPADPYWSRTALYSYLNLVDMPPLDLTAVGSSTRAIDMKSMLALCADSSAASEAITTGLTHMLSKAMNMLPEEIDPARPPNSYGVDSLVAVGVRNWVFSNCGVHISVFEVLSEKMIKELAADIALKGGFGLRKG